MKVDLSNCDREPIHLLGEIQPHGFLLAFDRSSWCLSYYSANAVDVLISEEDVVARRDISALLPEHLVKFARLFIDKELSRSLYQDPVSLSGPSGSADYRCHLSHGFDHCIFEFEPFDLQESSESSIHLSWLDSSTAALQKIDTEADLAAEISSKFREYTNFDRVMVYRFDNNFDGEIIGEDKAFGLESFLGLRYPASDIPVQARALYKSNLVRAIRDVEDTGVPVLGCGQDGVILDQSHTIYRSVSPIHIQYLKNMGVRATHANSLMVGGELWGMLICHHYGDARHLSLPRRLTSSFYAKAIESWLEQGKMRHLQEMLNAVNRLLEEIELNPGNHDLFELICSCWPTFQSIFQVDGFALQSGDDFASWPENLKIPKEALESEDTLFDSEYPIVFRESLTEADQESFIAGFAAISLNKEPQTRLILLRKEKTKLYNWAGNPEKAVILSESDDPLRSLSPRKSFELWQEKVSGFSLPWSDEDHDCLIRVRNTIRSSYVGQAKERVSKDDFSIINEANKQMKREIFQFKRDIEDLQKQQKDRDSALREQVNLSLANANLLANLSHEIRTPLNGIIGLSDLLRSNRDEEVCEFGDHIKNSGERMLLLFEKLLSFSKLEHSEIQKTEAPVVLEDLLETALQPHRIASQQKSVALDSVIHNKNTQVIADRFLIEQILSNLVGNAIKYTPKGGHVMVDMKFLIQDGECALKITVEDNGKGIAESESARIFEPFYTIEKEANVHDNSAGLGLYLIRSYIKSLGGSIDLTSQTGKGSRFTVIIPVEVN